LTLKNEGISFSCPSAGKLRGSPTGGIFRGTELACRWAGRGCQEKLNSRSAFISRLAN